MIFKYPVFFFTLDLVTEVENIGIREASDFKWNDWEDAAGKESRGGLFTGESFSPHLG